MNIKLKGATMEEPEERVPFLREETYEGAYAFKDGRCKWDGKELELDLIFSLECSHDLKYVRQDGGTPDKLPPEMEELQVELREIPLVKHVFKEMRGKPYSLYITKEQGKYILFGQYPIVTLKKHVASNKAKSSK